MDNNLTSKNIMNFIDKQIFNINWDNKNPNYESLNLNSNLQTEDMNNIGIVIDNGSYECRAGWSTSDEPNLRFRSIVAKPKVPSKHADNEFLVGNDILAYEQGKLHKKSPFEKNIVTHFGTQEHILDHVFSTLSKTKDFINLDLNEINHPVVLTEPLCNLNWSRKNLTEMMFELYSVPSLSYGVDMLFSLHNNKNSLDTSNCLIISSSYQTTHIVPILNGRLQIEKTRRIGVGSLHGLELLTKSLHLKYPDLRNKLTNELIQEIQEKYTMCAKDYKKQLKLLELVFEYDQEKLKEEEKKRIFGSLEMYEKAFSEQNAKKNLLANSFNYLRTYKNQAEYRNCLYNSENKINSLEDNVIKELAFFEWPKSPLDVVLTEEEVRRKQDMRKEQSKRLRELMQKKREENLKNMEKELEELEQIMQIKAHDKYQFEEAVFSKGFTSEDEMQKRINKIFMKINFNKENKEQDERIDEEKRWPLLNIPDEDLTEDQIKAKRIQKMQRNAYVTRLEKRMLLNKEKERIEQLKQQDSENYLLSLYKKKKELLDRLDNFKQIRKEYSNRHSKTNLKRMMVLAELGKENITSSSKKKVETTKDDFGVKDEDWDVYRGISRHNLSEDEEEDRQHLDDIEAQIIEMDPNYFKYSESLTQGFMYGTQHFFLGTDQFRGAELLFQPYLIGIEQSGIIELILSVFKTMTPDEQRLLSKNIFLTGGNTKTKYLEQRIYTELRSNLNCDFEINIYKADDPELDAWKGAAKFMQNNENTQFFITRDEYNEYGAEYYKEHYYSNEIINPRGSHYSGREYIQTPTKKQKL